MKKKTEDVKDRILEKNTTSAYALENDLLSKEQQKYNQAMSDDTGSEWWIHTFLQPYKGSSETVTTQRQKKLTNYHHTPGCRCSCIPAYLHRWARLWEASRPGNHLASHTRSILFSSQNKSACAWTVEEWCRLRLWQMPHNKELPLNQDDQCSCHLVQSPEACQAPSHQSLQCKPTP